MPLIILAGKEYGSGSSRDWAAKGPNLLGVRAVIAESFERIHRSNLVGMGILPLQFEDGEMPSRSALTGEEVYDFPGLTKLLKEKFSNGRTLQVNATGLNGDKKTPCNGPHRHAAGDRVLRARRHTAVRPPPTRGEIEEAQVTGVSCMQWLGAPDFAFERPGKTANPACPLRIRDFRGIRRGIPAQRCPVALGFVARRHQRRIEERFFVMRNHEAGAFLLFTQHVQS